MCVLCITGLECLTALQELQSFCMLGNHGLSDGVVVKSGDLHLTMFELQAGAQVRPAQAGHLWRKGMPTVCGLHQL